jgi:hypothetical protein
MTVRRVVDVQSKPKEVGDEPLESFANNLNTGNDPIRPYKGDNSMNRLNTATLEASQRLYEKGIVLETEQTWVYYVISGWELMSREKNKSSAILPAPSMAEVWRELPDGTEIFKQGNDNIGWYSNGRTIDANPTDTLIDLLIWITEKRKEENHG